MRLRGRLTLLSIAASLCGCVHFRGNELPIVPVDSLAKSKIEHVTSRFELGFDDVDDPGQIALYKAIFDEKLSHVFADTHRADARLQLDVVLASPSMSPWIQPWLEISVLTACIIPVHHEDVYTLRVRAAWDGKPLKTYQYEDSLSLWVWLFFLPLMPAQESRTKAQLDLIRNLETNFLADLSRDLETLPAAPGPGVTSSPAPAGSPAPR